MRRQTRGHKLIVRRCSARLYCDVRSSISWRAVSKASSSEFLSRAKWRDTPLTTSLHRASHCPSLAVTLLRVIIQVSGCGGWQKWAVVAR